MSKSKQNKTKNSKSHQWFSASSSDLLVFIFKDIFSQHHRLYGNEWSVQIGLTNFWTKINNQADWAQLSSILLWSHWSQVFWILIKIWWNCWLLYWLQSQNLLLMVWICRTWWCCRKNYTAPFQTVTDKWTIRSIVYFRWSSYNCMKKKSHIMNKVFAGGEINLS